MSAFGSKADKVCAEQMLRNLYVGKAPLLLPVVDEVGKATGLAAMAQTQSLGHKIIEPC